MEKLELLAQRIDVLLQELARLRAENGNLRDELELSKLETADIQEKFNNECALRDEAITRMDALISRIQSSLPAEEQQS